MLGHQLQQLPPFEDFWHELPRLFNWLDGNLAPEELPSISLAKDEEAGWAPPPSVWVWGQGIPLESVRFAAANHLCVELGYGGTKRLIEPYSLRRTRDGHLLLYAVKAQTSELRSYRVDRMQSINVTNRPYKPRYLIEFASAGPLNASSTQRLTSHTLRIQPFTSDTVFVIECSYCGKKFKRSSHDTHLRPHKDKSGAFDCPGRIGYEVDRY